MASRPQRVRAYAERFHESLTAGLDVEDVVRALADACKRAIEDETPSNTRSRKRKVAFYAKCAEVLGEAAGKIREAT